MADQNEAAKYIDDLMERARKAQATIEFATQEQVDEVKAACILEIEKMGADIEIDGGTAIVNGVDGLRGSRVVASDLRAGAALVSYAALFLPVGMGLQEVTLAYLLSAFVPWPVAVAISLLARFGGIIGDTIGVAIASRL